MYPLLRRVVSHRVIKMKYEQHTKHNGIEKAAEGTFS